MDTMDSLILFILHEYQSPGWASGQARPIWTDLMINNINNIGGGHWVQTIINIDLQCMEFSEVKVVNTKNDLALINQNYKITSDVNWIYLLRDLLLYQCSHV